MPEHQQLNIFARSPPNTRTVKLSTRARKRVDDLEEHPAN